MPEINTAKKHCCFFKDLVGWLSFNLRFLDFTTDHSRMQFILFIYLIQQAPLFVCLNSIFDFYSPPLHRTEHVLESVD